MPDLLVLRVIGTPGPQGSKNVYNGRVVESSKLVKPWRLAVANTGAAAMRVHGHGGWPSGPVEVAITFWLARPAYLPKIVGHPAKRPDLDKLIRSTFDGLTESGVVRDDAQIVQVRARKCFAPPGHPTGAVIKVSTAEAP
jgi:Holliday junction resolvase RusA-like endonuclease